MNKTTRYISFALAVLFAAACSKDDSTGFEVDCPDVRIIADDTQAFAIGEESSFEPAIEWDGTSESDYTYSWTLEGKEEICNERILRYSFATTGSVYVTFHMTHKATGVIYSQDFKCTVTSLYALGWAILSRAQDSSSQLSFIHMNSFQLHPDIYSQVNSEPLGKNPVRLEMHAISKTDQILVIQEGGKSLIEVDGTNFKKASDLQYEFIGEQYPEQDFAAERVAYTNRSAEMVISKSGKIYDRTWGTSPSPTSSSATFQSMFFSPQPFIFSAGDCRITYCTYPGDNSNYLPLYDGLGRRWLAYHHATTMTYSIPEFVCTATFEDGYNWCSGVASDVNLKFAQTYNISSYKSNLLSIFEKGGVYSVDCGLLTYASATHKITVTTPTHKVIPDGYGINDASVFFMPHGAGTKFANNVNVFFSVGRKLYFWCDTDGKVYLFRDFANDENAPSGDIVDIEQNGNATQLGVAFSDGHFFICNLKDTLLTAIRQSNLDPQKVDNDLVLAHVKDIPGTIVDASFKFGKVANYTGYKIAY